VVDCLAGIVLLVYGFYLYSTLKIDSSDPKLQWTFASSMSLGILLTLASCFSFIGISADSCRCALSVSAWLTIPVALTELVLAIVFSLCKDEVFDLLDEEKEKLHLTQEAFETFQMWYQVVVWVLFGLFMCEVVRFHVSKNLRDAINLDIDEYYRLLDKEQEDRQTWIADTQQRLLERQLERKVQLYTGSSV